MEVLFCTLKKKRKKPSEIWHYAFSSVEGVLYAKRVKSCRNVAKVEDLEGVWFISFIQSN